MTQQRGRKLSSVKIAAMEQDWITSTVRSKRGEFAQKHDVGERTVQKYYEQGGWKLKRLAYWESLAQTVSEVSKVSLAQASERNGHGKKTAPALQREETVSSSVEVVGRFVAEAVNQREDQTTKMVEWMRDMLIQTLQGITVNNSKPLVLTGASTDEQKQSLLNRLGDISPKDRLRVLPAIVDRVIDAVKILEVMQGRPDHTLGIVGLPQDLTPEEEQALEVVRRISLRASGEEA